MTRTLVLLLLCLSLPPGAVGQESVETLLDRGYVAHWLVCGPFAPDVAGGIPAALARGGAALGGRDYMAPVGGAARVRPEHLLVVETPEGEALWQRAGAQGTVLDLAPFFPGGDPGVAYAAFYARSEGRALAFVDLQTPLGARVWFNGFPLRDIAAAPVAAAGADRFALVFRPGVNLLMLELPGASLETLAQAADLPVRAFTTRGLANRPLLTGRSGYEFALAIRRAEPAGPLLYVPKLESTGTFSGSRFDVRQDAELTLFNPTENPVGPVGVSITLPDRRDPLVASIPSIPPQSDWREPFGIPAGGAIAGQSIRLVVELNTGADLTRFRTALTALEPAEGGKVFLVTGRRYGPGTAEDQAAATERLTQSTARQAILAEREPDYGFDLGHVRDWQAAVVAAPGILDILRDSIARGRCGTRLGLAPVDERLVTGEVLLRNLAMGLTAAERRLGDLRPTYDATGLPGTAPQTPHLLGLAGLPGLVGDTAVEGAPALFLQHSPAGSTAWYRRRAPVTGPATVEELRRLASRQRREMLGLGVTADLVLSESVVQPPEPFYLGAAEKLSLAYPPIFFHGCGAREFFDELGYLPVATRVSLPRSARLLTGGFPGDVAAQPRLKDAWHRTAARLGAAERFAAFAGVLGAAYPDAALDLAWRQLILHATTDMIGHGAREQDYIDALAALREAADLADEVMLGATGFLARAADTRGAGAAEVPGAQALVVFNPAARTRSELCTATLYLDEAPGLTLLDGAGAAVPFLVEEARRGTRGLDSVRVRFVARDVPGLGYATYHAVPTGALPAPAVTQDLQVENETWLVQADPDTGDIVVLVNKATGENLAAGPLNRVVALEEDGTRNLDGRGLWTNGRDTVAGPGLTRIETRVTPWMQEMTVDVPFGGDTLTRRVTLYAGLPEVYCETRVETEGLDGRLLVLSNRPPGAGRAPVYGERFAAVTARRCADALVLRTDASGNPTDCAAQPALAWAALGPSDQVQVGGEGVFPLVPAAVIHGSHPELADAARAVQQALAERGIPAWTWPDTPPVRDAVWSDSTDFADYDGDLDTGGAMRILVGSPEQNAYCADLFAALAPDTVGLLTERLATGASLFLTDDRAPERRPAAPTLVFAGLTEMRSGALAEDLALAIAARGVYVLPPSSFAAGDPEPRAESGLAVLFSGVRLCNAGADGELAVVLGRLGDEPCGEGLAFSYRLLPYAGTWRDAQVPQAAHHAGLPFEAVAVPPERGEQPAAHGFLSLDQPGFLLSAVRPAGYPLAAGSARPATPRNGLVARGWESTGRAWDGHVSTGVPLHNALALRFPEDPGASIGAAGARVPWSVAPFHVDGLWLLPEPPPLRGAPEPIAREASPFGAHHARYWRHNPGAAPLGDVPLSLLLRGSLGPGDDQVYLTVANLLTDETLSGTVAITAAAGWSVGPMELDYHLEPGEVLDEKLVILRAADARDAGGIEARTTYGGQAWRDVLEEEAEPLSLAITRNEGQVRVTIVNRGGIPAEGVLDLVAGPALWPELGRPAPVNVLPRRAAVNVPPFRAQDVLFRFSDPAVAPWAVARLAANGHVVYAPVPAPAAE